MPHSNRLSNPYAMNPAALDHSKSDRCPRCGKPNGLNGHQAMRASYAARLCDGCYSGVPERRQEGSEGGL